MLAVGVGVAAQGDSTASSDRSAPGMMRGPGGDLSKVADELGVSKDKVREALESAMPRGGGPPPATTSGS